MGEEVSQSSVRENISTIDYKSVVAEHQKWLPSRNAYPPGKDSFPEDRYDEKVQEFREVGIPMWLK